MGLAPVMGVLGVASSVGGLFQSGAQAKAQEQAAAANKKAAQANAAIRQAEINSKRDYANYQSRLNALTRQQQYMQMDMGLQAQGILDQMSQQQNKFALDSGLNQQKTQSVQERMGADAMEAGANQQAAGERIGAAGQSTETQYALAQQAQGTGQMMEQGNARRAAMQTILAATSGSPGRTEMVLEQKDLEGDMATALASLLQQQGISEMDLQNLLYSQDISEISRQLGVSAADFRRANADRADMFAQTQYSYGLQDLNTGGLMSKANLEMARKSGKFANMMDENSDAINRIFADQGFAQQSNAVQNQLGAQMASIQAQQSQIQKPGLLDYLGVGMKAFQSFSPMMGGGGSQGVTPNNSSSYGLLNGYSLTPYSGSTQQPDLSGQMGFTSRPIGLYF